MSSFPAQAAKVRDAGLPTRRRLLALRECVLHFAPYGFRATWHHLVINAGLSVWLELEEQPTSLVRAIDELEEARRIWLAEIRAFQARRRQEKVAGRRWPRRDEGWHAWPQSLAFCPDPEVHPRERLATVVQRLIDVYRSGAAPVGVCPACLAARSASLCPYCGACPWDPAGARPPAADETGLPWPLIWHRAVRWETTVGGGDFGDFRVEFTPTSADGRFGIFQLYVRGVALGDASTTALYPHYEDVRELAESTEHGPRKLILGDTFDHLRATLEATDQELIFDIATWPGSGSPRWAPPVGTVKRLRVRRSEVVRAWRAAEPQFRRILQGS